MLPWHKAQCSRVTFQRRANLIGGSMCRNGRGSRRGWRPHEQGSRNQSAPPRKVRISCMCGVIGNCMPSTNEDDGIYRRLPSRWPSLAYSVESAVMCHRLFEIGIGGHGNYRHLPLRCASRAYLVLSVFACHLPLVVGIGCE